MKTTNELAIRGERTDLEHFLARVEALLHDGWKRDRQAEERRGRNGAPGPWAYCFSCTAKVDRPAAGLWVQARGPNDLSVSIVVPLEKQELNAEEYNRLLAEFEREFLGPAAAETGVKTEVVQHRPSLEHELSPEVVRLLQAFSVSANRACLTPADHRRWNTFLVRAHQDESLFDPALLDDWLQQQGWPENTRCQLVGEYEAGRSLLSVYEEEAERR
jgi:hypothetical protein